MINCLRVAKLVFGWRIKPQFFRPFLHMYLAEQQIPMIGKLQVLAGQILVGGFGAAYFIKSQLDLHAVPER